MCYSSVLSRSSEVLFDNDCDFFASLLAFYEKNEHFL